MSRLSGRRPEEAIEHALLVHGSAPLRPSPLYGRLVRGEEARGARRQAGKIRMPPDLSKGYTSIYELQTRPRPS